MLEACMLTHGVIISRSCKRAPKLCDPATGLINCDNIAGLDLFFLQRLYHLYAKVVYSFHLCCLQRQLALKLQPSFACIFEHDMSLAHADKDADDGQWWSCYLLFLLNSQWLAYQSLSQPPTGSHKNDMYTEHLMHAAPCEQIAVTEHAWRDGNDICQPALLHYCSRAIWQQR